MLSESVVSTQTQNSNISTTKINNTNNQRNHKTLKDYGLDQEASDYLNSLKNEIKKSRKCYPLSFKKKVVNLANMKNVNYSLIHRELGVSRKSVYTWVNQTQRLFQESDDKRKRLRGAGRKPNFGDTISNPFPDTMSIEDSFFYDKDLVHKFIDKEKSLKDDNSINNINNREKNFNNKANNANNSNILSTNDNNNISINDMNNDISTNENNNISTNDINNISTLNRENRVKGITINSINNYNLNTDGNSIEEISSKKSFESSSGIQIDENKENQQDNKRIEEISEWDDDDKCYDFLSECLTKSLRKIQFSFEERKKLVELTFLNKKRFPIERISKLSGVPVKALELWRGNDYKVFIDKDLVSQSIVLEKQPQTSGNIKEIEKLKLIMMIIKWILNNKINVKIINLLK